MESIMATTKTAEEIFDEKIENASNKNYNLIPKEIQTELMAAAFDATKESPKEIREAVGEAVADANKAIGNMTKSENYFTPNPDCWKNLYKMQVKVAKEALRMVKEASKNRVDQAVSKVETNAASLTNVASEAIAQIKKIPETLSRESVDMEYEALAFRRLNDNMKEDMAIIEKLRKETEDLKLQEFYAQILEENRQARQHMMEFLAMSKNTELNTVHPERMNEFLVAAKEAYTNTVKTVSVYMSGFKQAAKTRATNMQKNCLKSIRDALKKCNVFLKSTMDKVKKEVNERVATGKKVYTAVSRLRPALSVNVGITSTDTKENMVDKYINTERTKPIEQMINRMARSGMTMKDIERQKAAFLEGVSKSFDAAMQKPEVKKITATNTVALAH